MRRINDVRDIWKERFGPGVRKACLRLGTSCPNRDGSLGRSGCYYCGERPAVDVPSITDQLQTYLRSQRSQRRHLPIVAYLQDHSATYLHPERLNRILLEIRTFKEVVAIHLGTRPDCLPDPILDVLCDHSDRIELLIEVGLQTASDSTLRAMNRGHDVKTFYRAIEQLQGRKLRACAHVILGLPAIGTPESIACATTKIPLPPEDTAAAAATAHLLTQLGIAAVKIHNCHVLRGTPLATLFEQGAFLPPSLSGYIELLAAFLQHLDPAIEIHRLLGEAPPSLLLAPDFTADKARSLAAIRQALQDRDIFQGQRLSTLA